MFSVARGSSFRIRRLPARRTGLQTSIVPPSSAELAPSALVLYEDETFGHMTGPVPDSLRIALFYTGGKQIQR